MSETCPKQCPKCGASMSEKKQRVKAEILDYLRDCYAEDPDCGESDLESVALGTCEIEEARSVLAELEAEGEVVHTHESDDPRCDTWEAVPGRVTWDDNEDAKETIAELRAELTRLQAALAEQTKRAEEAEAAMKDWASPHEAAAMMEIIERERAALTAAVSARDAAVEEVGRLRDGLNGIAGQCAGIREVSYLPYQVRGLASDIESVIAALLAPAAEEVEGG